jgi:chromosome segregation ATPase
MQDLMKAVLALGMLMRATDAADSEVTPVQKVIQMMQAMLAKGEKEKHEEEVQFAAYKQFCDDTASEKQKAIADANEQIEVLKADIFAFTSDAEKLGKEIAGHDEDIAVWEGDVSAAKKVREIEKADYDAMHKDYSESIDALGRAIDVLKKKSGDKAQAELVQVASLKNFNLIPPEAKRAINAFIQQGSEETVALSAPEANAYEFQSQGIIDMLQKLLDKFTGELTTLEKEESNSVHEFEMLQQDLKNAIAHSTEAREIASATKAKKLQAKADAEGSLQDTTTTLADDTKYLEDLVATCEQKASDFESRQKLRAEEIVAINKAIDIISSGAVKNAEKHLPSLVQTTALVQLRADGQSPVRKRVAAYLREKGSELNSRILTALAVRVDSDPFKKIKKIIKDLITKLLEEANEEAEHKGWCDVELGTNKQTRDEKTEAVVMLTAEIDELTASMSKLTEEITELTAAVGELDAAVAKATNIRSAEKEKNTQSLADSAEAQAAVAKALTVLREFYAKAAQATALVQEQQEPPPTFDEPYKGQGDAGGGVIGMLEVIQSDFARVEAETKAAEEIAQKEYDQFMTDSEVDKTQKTSDIDHKTKLKQDQSKSLEEKQSDLEGTQKELDAALDYYEKLKPSCVDSGESFEDRVKRRKEEIQSLQDALQILNGEDIAR